MILLDTNVVSEAIKSKPDTVVQAWLDEQAAESLYLSAVSVAELLFGIAVLPAGKRRDGLEYLVKSALVLFRERTLAFDADAARHYAGLASRARIQGRGLQTPDGYIAAIASSRGFTVASRDTAPFNAAGVPVVNPWKT